jgi:hypothetical protein
VVAMITATARSSTLPLNAKSRNSFSITLSQSPGASLRPGAL